MAAVPLRWPAAARTLAGTDGIISINRLSGMVLSSAS
jgi:hypothetical protein